MGVLFAVVLPVFLVLGFGYLAARLGWMSPAAIDGVTQFSQSFALPVLLFRAMSGLDLEASFQPGLLAAFYAGVLAAFVVGIVGALVLFRRPVEDAIAIGFAAFFSNTLLLGLPITERAYGPDALAGNYAIISMHAPLLYIVGITVMEAVRARGTSLSALPGRILRQFVRNGIVLGVAAGLAFNLTGLTIPEPAAEAIDLIAASAIPAALFGLGGTLTRYRPEGDMRAILFVVAICLLLHPAITYGLARAFGLGTDAIRSAVLTAAMAPGVNAFLFANVYGTARRVAASSVLIGTGLCVLTATFWLMLLP
ncbi:AEC family transporter [Wenxinia saemankumensis]|uniref:Malonate transporter n=1 Tax=Wenxinia saemankumensis TaxID=1447782 RepID=A0A1M6HAG1_9RHOB|nr:AEC family transporter [Wenxinia saemankumensis]SHJ19103.1 hypothetical protein SAMN05444417_3115 [Wenxinia saemankumensis]